MSRPKGTKNVMRSPEEKLQILHEFFDSGWNASLICKKHNIAQSSLRKWRLQFEQGGLPSLSSNTGKYSSNLKGRPKLSNEDKLKRQIRDLEIEVARLKKGYLVKGGGAKKEFVTLPNVNTK